MERNYAELTTDRLVELIVTEVGIPIPTYDYDLKRFHCRIPQNVRFGDIITGIEELRPRQTLRDACIEILMWHDSLSK